MRVTLSILLLLSSTSLSNQASPFRGLQQTACESSCTWADGTRCLPTATALRTAAAGDQGLQQAVAMEALCYKGKAECQKDTANCQWGPVDGTAKEGCTVSATKLNAYNVGLVDISQQCGAMGDNFRGQQYCTGLSNQQQCENSAAFPANVTCKWQPAPPNTPCAVGVCGYVSPQGASDQGGDVYRQMTQLILNVRMQHPANMQCPVAQDAANCQAAAGGMCVWNPAAAPYMCQADGVKIAEASTDYSADARAFAKCNLAGLDVQGCLKMSDYCEVVGGVCVARSDKLTAAAYPAGCSLRAKTEQMSAASKQCANTNGSKEACDKLADVCAWVETESEVCEVISYPVYDANGQQIFGAARVEEKKNRQKMASCVVKPQLAAQIMSGIAPAAHTKVLKAHDVCAAATTEAACSKVC